MAHQPFAVTCIFNRRRPRWRAGSVIRAIPPLPAGTPPPAATPTATPGARLPGTGATPPAYTPSARAPYGNITTDQLQQKTIAIGPGVRLDPVTRQKYTQGNDQTWRTGGTATSVEVQQLVKTYGLPPERQQALQNPANPGTTLASNIALSATPGLREKGVAGTAGIAGNVRPQDAPTIPGLEQFTIPGAGVSAEGQREEYNINRDLNTLRSSGINGPRWTPGPGIRTSGQTGNSIQFGEGGARNSSLIPQLQFPETNLSLPKTYIEGTGGSSDIGGAFRATDVPINVSDKGVTNMTVTGPQNAEIRGGGVGTGWVNSPFAYNSIAKTFGRDVSDDPAKGLAQVLMIMQAAKGLGGGQTAINALTTPAQEQYGGWLPGTGPGAVGTTNLAGFSTPAPPPAPAAIGVGPDGQPLRDAVAAPAPPGAPPTGGAPAAPPVAAPPVGAPAPIPGAVPGSPYGTIAGTIQALLDGSRADKDEDAGNERDSSPFETYGKGGTVKTYASGGDFVSMGRFGAKTGSGPLGVVAPVEAGATAPELGARGGAASAPPPANALTAPAAVTEAPVTNQGGVAPEPIDVGGQLDLTGLATGADLQPFQDAATRIASEQHARANQGYVRNLAGLGPEQAVPIVSGQALGNLGPGQFWDKGGALTRSITGIADQQAKARELGGEEDYAATQSEITRLQQEQEPFSQALQYATKLQGLGNVGDAAALQEEINALKAQAGPLAEIQDVDATLAGLGNPLDTSVTLGQISAIQQQIAQLQAEIAARPDPSWAAQLQQRIQQEEESLVGLKNQLGVAQAHNNKITSAQNLRNNLISASGLAPDQISAALAQFQAQLGTKGQALTNAQEAAKLRQTIEALVGAGVDPIARHAAIAGQLDPLKASASGILGRNQQRSQLAQTIQNLVKAGPPQFAGGGTMVTDEPVVGMGMFSGTPRFIVGEPTRPGGPPRAERLKITPMHEDAPMGRFARAA